MFILDRIYNTYCTEQKKKKKKDFFLNALDKIRHVYDVIMVNKKQREKNAATIVNNTC